jgi:hypothetical protein
MQPAPEHRREAACQDRWAAPGGWPASRLRPSGWIVALLLAWVGGAGALTIELSANPKRVPADGTSTITVTAVVRDGATLVREGVAVVFVTSAGGLLGPGEQGSGAVQARVPVSGGRAQVLLRAPNYETSAQLTASIPERAGTPVDQLSVSFGALSAASVAVDNLIRVRASYLCYYPEPSLMILEAIGDAVLTYQGVEIRAPRLHLDLQDYLVVARDLRGELSIGLGPPPYKPRVQGDQGPPYSGEALAVELRSFHGACYSAQSGEMVHFSGRSLARVSPKPTPAGLFDPFDVSAAKLSLRARRAVVYPDRKIRFDRPKFYVGDKQVLSLPYYFEHLGYSASAGMALSQMISYSTQDGLVVDFPYYFDMGDRHTNELRLARGRRTGLFGRQTGFQLLYNHHTDLKRNRGDFDLTVDNITERPGVSFQRTQRFSATTFGGLSATWPQFRNFYSNANLYSTVGPGSVSVTANADYLRGAGAGLSANANAVWQSYPWRVRPLRARCSVALGTGYSRLFGGRDLWRENVSFSLDREPWRPTRGGSLLPSAGLRYQYTVGEGHETALTCNTFYRQELTRQMSVTMGYTFDTAWSTRTARPDRHQFTANWQWDRLPWWRGYAFANYSVRDRTLSSSLLLDRRLTQHLGAEAQAVWQDGPYGSFHETELSLYRTLGIRELRLRYNVERGKVFFELDNQF